VDEVAGSQKTVARASVRAMSREPHFCQRCREPYRSETLAECVSCTKRIRPGCGLWRINMETRKLHLICDPCRTNRRGWWSD
jgi:hypothetical protein